jgi:hypothetical protein
MGEEKRMTRKHDADADRYECSECKEMRPRADYGKHKTSLFGLNAVCKPCVRVKSQKRWAETRAEQRAKRATLAPVAPKPEQRPLYKAVDAAKATTPDSVRYRSANAIVYPVDPIERCIHSGACCDAQDGFALAHELFCANTCGGIVRGYFATVGRDAEGWITPRFARKESAALWTKLIRVRCGATDERRAA